MVGSSAASGIWDAPGAGATPRERAGPAMAGGFVPAGPFRRLPPGAAGAAPRMGLPIHRRIWYNVGK